jgi:mannose-6-phosphate isomerase
MRMLGVTGVVQHYAWGDPVSIPELLGVPSDGEPWAELWFGTHPGAPSTVDGGAPLSDVAGELPYLLKVLAAGEALSLQTHPSAEQAARGFAREEAAGIARDAPERTYRDPDAKPELLCALTPFDALCGFRPVAATSALLRRIGAVDLARVLERDGLRSTVTALYRGEIDTASTVAACQRRDEPEAQLVRSLAAQYPDDPSVVVTLLLHRVHLRPGEAIFLGPGNLHAYLHGVGVEIMGASDNVVRGGLTVKHVDVDELLDVLDI